MFTTEEVRALRLEEIIPHRGDWSLARRVRSINFEEGQLVVECPIPANPGWKDEHYPKNPVMPGHLIDEACAQGVGVFAWIMHEELRNKIAVLRETDIKQRGGGPVPPNNMVLVVVEKLNFRSDVQLVTGKVKAYLSRIEDEFLLCEGKISLSIVDPEEVQFER